MEKEGKGGKRYVDVQTVQDHVDACFQASLAGIDLAKCRKLGGTSCESGSERVNGEWTREQTR